MKRLKRFFRLTPRTIVLLIILATFLALFKIATVNYLGSAQAWYITLFALLVIVALQTGFLTLFAKLLPRVFIPLSVLAILFGLYKLATIRYAESAGATNTLLDFIRYTKGVEYLIAIAFLLSFIAFWRLMHYRGKEVVIRTIPLAVLALGFSTLAYSCISSSVVATTNPSAGELPLRNSPVLVEMYGPASFDHALHQRVVDGGCIQCHHYSDNKYNFPSCSECHNAPFDPQDLNKPGLARAYHLLCIGCHRDSQVGPTDCTGCHTKTEHPPSSPSHPLAGMGDCLKCHEAGGSGALGMPADHADATNGVCLLCHTAQPGGER
jgi:hypothetical protein